MKRLRLSGGQEERRDQFAGDHGYIGYGSAYLMTAIRKPQDTMHNTSSLRFIEMSHLDGYYAYLSRDYALESFISAKHPVNDLQVGLRFKHTGTF